MNIISIILIIAVAVGFVAALRHSRKNGCCGHCDGCQIKCRNKNRDC